ncbi:hypothetical protein PC129_g11087 [Phytophthora cactorum]|nr:hypothetical protein Pcac1_g18591 [Phytophthora cactorum]KAG2903563.1 hypothetical protein PC114_g12211 [Phytophthora cactorum]KAG2914815.1 hypothetical protein PC115_g11573 [Phytophthora cactorum]KAG2927093.1 hypothetical protein PC117_g14688 [Phytophthora cactorum]KAG3157844.1 hypothetical protein C6341_g14634 [Phytophthora cactorum]
MVQFQFTMAAIEERTVPVHVLVVVPVELPTAYDTHGMRLDVGGVTIHVTEKWC